MLEDVEPVHFLEKPKRSADFEPFHYPPGVSPEAWAHWLQSFSVETVCAYAWQAKPGWSLPRRKIGDSMWFFITRGRGFGASENQPDGFRFTDGTAILIPCGAWHWLELDKGSSLEFFTVHFHATVLNSFEALHWLGFPTVVNETPLYRFEDVSFYLAREHALLDTRTKAALSVEIRALLFRLARNHAQAFKPRLGEGCSGGSRCLRDVLDYIEDHFSDPGLSVEEMAANAGVSTSYLHRLFKSLIGTTPNRHLNQLRLRRACEQLLTTDRSAAEIAYSCGFREPPYFHRVFHTSFSCTPKQFRRRALP